MGSCKSIQGLAAMLLAALAVPAAAQVAPLTCQASGGIPPTVAAEGYTELTGDFLVSCTGGTPTGTGLTVPQVNITLFLNTNLTSQELAPISGGGYFSEALLLVDEPNGLTTGNGILNCGQTGASDATSPGVCSIISTGNPVQTYNAAAGHPNAFQGRVGTVSNPAQLNAVTFLNLPIDPPGAGTRTLRITNLRANAASLVAMGTFAVQAQISASGGPGLAIGNPVQTIALISTGLLSSVTGAGTAAPSITLSEGFASAFKSKNISFTVGDNAGTSGNATYTGSAWSYNLGTHYPADDAQNVPGMTYLTETGFEWLNNTTNAPPAVNPPPGYSIVTVANVGTPFASALTGIQTAGAADAGARVAIQFQNIPSGATVTVPQVVYIYPCTACTASGVMVLTNANAAGAGPFGPSSVTALNAANNTAVYEVLYANALALESATVQATVSPSSVASGITETVSWAPFDSTAAAGQPSASLPVPRFIPSVPAFFSGEISVGSGVYYLQFPNTNLFGYYNFPSSSILYHYDMGFEAFIPGSAADVYFYDFTSGHWWYTSNTLFPYLYDFSLSTWLYYFPDTKNAGHYTTNPRYFSNLTTGLIFTM
jgi:hypothetical protein